MKAELTDISPVKKRFEIEIPETVVSSETDTIAREFSKRAKVPGFRPGKAPLGVVKNRYREDIQSELYQHLLPKYFAEAIQDTKLDLVDNPVFEEVTQLAGQPLRFKAVFEIYPTLDITNHDKIPVEEIPTEVTDEEIEEALERMSEEQAEMTPVEEDRGAEAGDFAEISFTGTIEGSDADPLTGEDVLCEVGGETTVKEFTEHLTGSRPGDEKNFEVKYGEEHPDAKLSGKTIGYAIRIQSLKQKSRPPLDDDFAQSLGEFETLDALRDQIRENIGKHKENGANEQTQEALLRWLQENNEFEVPESLIGQQTQIRLQRLVRDLAGRGVKPERLDVDWEKIREDQYAQAINDVRGSLILEHLADQEGVDATEEEIEHEIELVASGMNSTPDQVREALIKNKGLGRLTGQIRNRKVLELLQERAEIVPAGSLKNSEDSEETGLVSGTGE